MKKLKLLLLSILSLFLVSCGKQDYNIILHKDNSITLEMVVSRTEALESIMTSQGISEEQFQSTVEAYIEDYEQLGFAGIYEGGALTLTKSYPSYKEFNSDVERLYQEEKIGLDLNFQESKGFSKRSLTGWGDISYYLPGLTTTSLQKLSKDELQELTSLIENNTKEAVTVNFYSEMNEIKTELSDYGDKRDNQVVFTKNTESIIDSIEPEESGDRYIGVNNCKTWM